MEICPEYHLIRITVVAGEGGRGGEERSGDECLHETITRPLPISIQFARQTLFWPKPRDRCLLFAPRARPSPPLPRLCTIRKTQIFLKFFNIVKNYRPAMRE